MDTLSRINEIFKAQKYPAPDLTRALMIQTMVKDEEIVGVGLIQPIYEVVVAFDPIVSRKTKVELLQQLMVYGQIHCQKTGIDQWHVFVDSEFGDIVQKHFGFKKCKGEAFILNLR